MHVLMRQRLLPLVAAALAGAAFATVLRPASDELDALRERLTALGAEQDDGALVEGWWSLLREHGVAPLLVHGDHAPLGHGFQLLTQLSGESDAWLLRSPAGGDLRLPKEPCARVLTADGVRAELPSDPTLLAQARLLFCTSERLFVVDLEDGVVRAWPGRVAE
jgi:hypothetical protein